MTGNYQEIRAADLLKGVRASLGKAYVTAWNICQRFWAPLAPSTIMKKRHMGALMHKWTETGITLGDFYSGFGDKTFGVWAGGDGKNVSWLTIRAKKEMFKNANEMRPWPVPTNFIILAEAVADTIVKNISKYGVTVSTGDVKSLASSIAVDAFNPIPKRMKKRVAGSDIVNIMKLTKKTRKSSGLLKKYFYTKNIKFSHEMKRKTINRIKSRGYGYILKGRGIK